MHIRDLSMPGILKLFSTVAEKKFLCLGIWLGGKIYIVKTEKWIKSWYINSNTELWTGEVIH